LKFELDEDAKLDVLEPRVTHPLEAG